MGFGFGINEFKAGFFDRAEIDKKVAAGQKKALGKFGAFVRTRARSSIRKRKRVSLPGQPPSSHVGTYKNLIFFAYDPVAESVVIGPVKFKKGNVPALLEHGGPAVRKGPSGNLRTVYYRARPAIGPAGRAEATSQTFKALLSGMVK